MWSVPVSCRPLAAGKVSSKDAGSRTEQEMSMLVESAATSCVQLVWLLASGFSAQTYLFFSVTAQTVCSCENVKGRCVIMKA